MSISVSFALALTLTHFFFSPFSSFVGVILSGKHCATTTLQITFASRKDRQEVNTAKMIARLLPYLDQGRQATMESWGAGGGGGGAGGWNGYHHKRKK